MTAATARQLKTRLAAPPFLLTLLILLTPASFRKFHVERLDRRRNIAPHPASNRVLRRVPLRYRFFIKPIAPQFLGDFKTKAKPRAGASFTRA
jgi:hypothetical protein